MDVLDSIKINNSIYSIGQDITSISLNGTVYKLGKDRNTVGKNDAIGLNTSYPSTAFTKVESIQNTLPIGESDTHICMRVPNGYYDGSSFIGAVNSKMANLVPANIKWGVTIGGVTGIANAFASQYGTTTSSSTKVGFKDAAGVIRNFYFITVSMDMGTGNCQPRFFTAKRVGGDYKRMEFFTDLWNGFLIEYGTIYTTHAFALENNGYFKWNSGTVQIPVTTPGVEYEWCVSGKWYNKF